MTKKIEQIISDLSLKLNDADYDFRNRNGYMPSPLNSVSIGKPEYYDEDSSIYEIKVAELIPTTFMSRLYKKEKQAERMMILRVIIKAFSESEGESAIICETNEQSIKFFLLENPATFVKDNYEYIFNEFLTILPKRFEAFYVPNETEPLYITFTVHWRGQVAFEVKINNQEMFIECFAAKNIKPATLHIKYAYSNPAVKDAVKYFLAHAKLYFNELEKAENLFLL